MQEYSEHPLNRKYNIDTLFTSIWEFYKRWFPSLFIISFVLSLVTAFFSTRMDLSVFQDTTDPYLILESLKSMTVPYLVIILISLVANMLIQYWIIRKPLDPEGNIVNYAGTVIVRYFLPLLVVFIILGVFSFFAMILGLLLFIIGIFFAMIYVILFFVLASPVIMVENCGIGNTITRTFTLVHKRFWPNMGWMTVFILIVLVISLVLGAIIMIPFSGGFIRTLINPEAAYEILEFTKKPSFIILTALTNAVTMPLMPIFGLALYFNGRSYEQGSAGIGYSDPGPSVDDLTP
ncbi:MAG TPA: hypothetical protein VMW76_05810 [Bacteroidales bacterium]|nr:hypothetical protein [Bacteroidales bacterium]